MDTIHEDTIFKPKSVLFRIVNTDIGPLFYIHEIAKLLKIKDIESKISDFDQSLLVLHPETLLTKSGVQQLIHQSRRRHAIEILEYFDMVERPRYVESSYEDHFDELIRRVYPFITVKTCYRIGSYTIDIYLPDFNLVVEFSKKPHMPSAARVKRRGYIELMLCCKIIVISTRLSMIDAIGKLNTEIFGRPKRRII